MPRSRDIVGILSDCPRRRRWHGGIHDEYLSVIKLDVIALRGGLPSGNGPAAAVADALIKNVDRVYGVVACLIGQLGTRLGGVIELSIPTEIDRLDESRALTLFRLVQEAMTNIARHANARRVRIDICGRGEAGMLSCVDIAISDDGCGMDMGVARRGLGLVGMRERVAAFGGSLRVSSRPGAGFELTATIPVGSEEHGRAPRLTADG